MTKPAANEKKYQRLTDVDWEHWKPTEVATLLFVKRDRHVLLIHKKKGMGAGLINGPGGRVEPGETPMAGAIREVQEELRVTPIGVRPAGELLFQFADGFALHGYVFMASECLGVPQETDEAIPLWVTVDTIPYDKMWADDRHWVPLMLAGQPFRGRFVFDGDQMLDIDVAMVPTAATGEKPAE